MASSPISHLYFFGDSLTDQGVIHDLTSRNTIVTVPTPDSGYSDSFTNGEVYAGVAVDSLGISSANYAVGNAHAVGSLTFKAYVDTRIGAQLPPGAIWQPDADPADLAFDLNLGGQIGRFAADAAASPPPDGSAAAFFIGLNDYAEFTPTSPDTALAEGAALVKAVVGNTIADAGAAVSAGVDEVILATMPNFRFFPLSTLRPPEMLALGDQLVAAHNAGLVQGAAALEAMGAEVRFLDMARISAEVSADAGSFGFRADLFAQPELLGTGGNPTLVAQPDGSYRAVYPTNPAVAGVDPDQLGFWDYIHPTAALHGVWGIFTANSLDSETLFFGDGNDRITGTGGRDLILAGAGNDHTHARGGADTVLAGLGNDRTFAGAGADLVIAGSGHDASFGGNGSDVIADGAGTDASFGGNGRDLLIDGAGFDGLHGGRGDDAFVYIDQTTRGGTPAHNGGVFVGGAGDDTAYLVLDEGTCDASIRHGDVRIFPHLGLTLVDIEHVVILGPDDDLAAAITTPAPIADAALWNLI